MKTTIDFYHNCPDCRAPIESVSADIGLKVKLLQVGAPLEESTKIKCFCSSCKTPYDLTVVSVDGKAHHLIGGCQ